MGFVKNNENKVGKQVVLTESKKSLVGYFENGSIVTITDVDDLRGYSFSDSEGNQCIEAGWGGFREV